MLGETECVWSGSELGREGDTLSNTGTSDASWQFYYHLLLQNSGKKFGQKTKSNIYGVVKVIMCPVTKNVSSRITVPSF